MPSHLHLVAWTAALLLLLPSGSDAEDSPYDVDSESPFALRLLLDLRAVRQGPEASWLENGPGKTRYGGVESDGESDTVARFAVSQFALEPSLALPWGLRARAQLNWDVDIDVDGDFGAYDKAPRLIEATLRRQWGEAASGWGVQAGVLNAPFSFEHSGPAWTPRFMLSASALGSWLWEEGRIVGFEGEIWRAASEDVDVSGFGGFGWGPDQMGILVARRGWVLSDWLAGVNSDLPLPEADSESSVFDERDGRPAIYLGGTLAHSSQTAELRLGYYDNLGDLGVSGVWETRFGTAGIALRPLTGLELIVQGLVGSTTTRGGPYASDFSAWYPLVSYRYRQHRVSVRYDLFDVDDEDGGTETAESGYAVTFAYLFEFWLRHRVGFEYTYVDAERPSSLPAHLIQRGWQVSYRFRY